MTTRTQLIRRTAAALTLAATISAPSLLWAQGAAPAQPATMGFGEVAQHLTQQGFQNIREIERESDRLYEVKAQNAEGRWVELYVDSRSGEVLKQEFRRAGRDHSGSRHEGSGHQGSGPMHGGPRMQGS